MKELVVIWEVSKASVAHSTGTYTKTGIWKSYIIYTVGINTSTEEVSNTNIYTSMTGAMASGLKGA